jgi:hypothetical protein
VLERVADLRQHHPELAKPTIDRLMRQIDPSPERRSWAKGSFTVFANGVECFIWTGTKQDAIGLQKRYLETVNSVLNILDITDANSDLYANQMAAYLIACGMPKAGDADRRPGKFGKLWSAEEIMFYKYAILRYALRTHAPNTGEKFEDVFVGRMFEIKFNGDRARILEGMARAERGEFSDNDASDNGVGNGERRIKMRITELEEPCRLNPQDAVRIPYADLLALAGKQIDHPNSDLIPETAYVPRIPIDAAEAGAMLRMMTTVAGPADPAMPPRTYAGYTGEELSRSPGSFH